MNSVESDYIASQLLEQHFSASERPHAWQAIRDAVRGAASSATEGLVEAMDHIRSLEEMLSASLEAATIRVGCQRVRADLYALATEGGSAAIEQSYEHARRIKAYLRSIGRRIHGRPTGSLDIGESFEEIRYADPGELTEGQWALQEQLQRDERRWRVLRERDCFRHCETILPGESEEGDYELHDRHQQVLSSVYGAWNRNDSSLEHFVAPGTDPATSPRLCAAYLREVEERLQRIHAAFEAPTLDGQTVAQQIQELARYMSSMRHGLFLLEQLALYEMDLDIHGAVFDALIRRDGLSTPALIDIGVLSPTLVYVTTSFLATGICGDQGRNGNRVRVFAKTKEGQVLVGEDHWQWYRESQVQRLPLFTKHPLDPTLQLMTVCEEQPVYDERGELAALQLSYMNREGHCFRSRRIALMPLA